MKLAIATTLIASAAAFTSAPVAKNSAALNAVSISNRVT
jgi:hypothetical protein